MKRSLQLFIDGAWTDSEGGTRHQVTNPSTETPVHEITLGSVADIDRAVTAARRAFDHWSRTSIDDRKALLNRIIAEYRTRIPDLAQSMSEEMGAPIGLAQVAQAPSGLAHFVAALAALDDFSFEERIGDALVRHEPLGVVAMITPWNWPLNQICAKVAPALAAGDTIILKPSEEAPGCAMILAEILEKAGTPPGVFNLVNGDGPSVGAALAAHPDIDMISITGSTGAGIAVAKAAAPTVKRVHQELGGKAANLILPGADLSERLLSTLTGVLANSGQSCIAPTRLLVYESQLAEVEATAAAIFAGTPVGPASEAGPHIGPVVSRAQYDKIQQLIASALDEGARLLCGGPGRPDGCPTGYFVRPTLFTDVRPDMRIYREEVFGPVATISSYSDIDEAVAMANDSEYGLSTAITGDPQAAAAVAPRLRAGLVTINGWSPDPAAPFGGYKRSGNGRENGRFGLAEFMEIKTILGMPPTEG